MRASDKRLARSRRHHPSVAFTREKYQDAIHALVNRRRETGTASIRGSFLREKEIRRGDQARFRIDALVNITS